MRRDRNGLEILSREECLFLLASRPVGRVGITRHALPAIHPVTYALIGSDVVFATGVGSSYLAPSQDAVIAFEVDDVDLVTRCGWSVLVVGVGRRDHLAKPDDIGKPDHLRVTQPDAALGASPPIDLDVEFGPWAGPQAVHVIRLATDCLSGRRLSGRPAIAP